MDWDRAYANADFIQGAADFPPRWKADAQSFRSQLGNRAVLDQSYGPSPRQRYDLFLPEGAPKGIIIFIHGGFWLAFGREDWSHFAAGPLAQGYAVALPSYTHAPEARIADITREIGAAITAIAARLDGPIHITGHSAGGHLAARMMVEGGPLPAQVLARVKRVVPISPLADLETLLPTKMNARLRLDTAEVALESPARLTPIQGIEALVLVGGQERPSFLWQARILSEAWDCPWQVLPDLHHFNVLDPLTDPNSAVTKAVIGAV